MSRGKGHRGFTLVELMIAISVLAMISGLLYGAFNGLANTRAGVSRLANRFHEGRAAIRRISHELRGAYLSAHIPINQNLAVQATSFIGTRDRPTDRVDFNSFSHRRLDRNSKESDQAEISYFGSPNPDGSGRIDLVRRISPRLDLEPDRGGRIQVLATDVDQFELSYLDASSGQWVDKWDTTQALGQSNQLPLQVRVLLTLNGGQRRNSGSSQKPLRFVTKVGLAMRGPLTFGVE